MHPEKAAGVDSGRVCAYARSFLSNTRANKSYQSVRDGHVHLCFSAAAINKIYVGYLLSVSRRVTSLSIDGRDCRSAIS